MTMETSISGSWLLFLPILSNLQEAGNSARNRPAGPAGPAEFLLGCEGARGGLEGLCAALRQRQ